MKMRKLISLCGALAIALSSVASAAIDTKSLTVDTNVIPMDNETFVEYYDEDIPEGKAAYMVEFSVSGLEDELSYTKTGGTNAKPKLTGKALDTFEVIFAADNLEAIDQDYTYIIDSATASAVGEGFTADGWTANYASNFVFPGAKDTVAADGDVIFTLCVVADATATINFTAKDGCASIFEYSNSDIAGQKDYAPFTSNMSFANGGFTVAPATVEVEDVVVNSGDKYDNGYVWNVTVNKDMETFGVKFYAGEDSIEKSVKNVEDLPKLDGGVGYEFNVGLKTAKTIDQADFTADGYTATWN